MLGKYLVDYAHYKHQFSAVGDVAGDMGPKVAVDLMEAGKILSEQVKGLHTVGGPTHIFILDREHPQPSPLQ